MYNSKSVTHSSNYNKYTSQNKIAGFIKHECNNSSYSNTGNKNSRVSVSRIPSANTLSITLSNRFAVLEDEVSTSVCMIRAHLSYADTLQSFTITQQSEYRSVTESVARDRDISVESLWTNPQWKSAVKDD